MSSGKIIESLFEHCYGEHKCQRNNIGTKVSDSQLRYDLRQRHEEEIKVEEKLELFVENNRDECDGIILGIGDGICRVRRLSGVIFGADVPLAKLALVG